MERRTLGGCSVTSQPFKMALPRVGLRRVHRMLIVVVLPAPLGARKPNPSPRGTWKETPFTAVTAAPPLTLNSFHRSSAMIILQYSRISVPLGILKSCRLFFRPLLVFILEK